MYKAVIFDFDYTLGDSTNGIVLSINHALEKLGFRAQDTKTIQRTIGLSLKDTLFELTGIQDEETAQKFTQYFKEKADEMLQRKKELLALIHLDIDPYHDIVDIYGRETADNVLRILGTELNRRVVKLSLIHI